ncbi:hypothetical protein ACFL14_00420 [Patescibacteria group bacterium]
MSETAAIKGLPSGAIPIGEVTNFFTNKLVAAVKILPEEKLEIGDEILFFRKDMDDWESMKVTSLHMDREPISIAKGGDHVGVLTGIPVGRRTTIYRKPQPS